MIGRGGNWLDTGNIKYLPNYNKDTCPGLYVAKNSTNICNEFMDCMLKGNVTKVRDCISIMKNKIIWQQV